MIIDITLEDNRFLITVLKEFLTHNEMVFLRPESGVFKGGYEKYGTFLLPGTSLGFEGCMNVINEDEQYLFFEFPFPEQVPMVRREKDLVGFSKEGSIQMLRFTLSLHLLFQYPFDFVRHEKSIDAECIEDQSMSFDLAGAQGRSYLAGKTYPWFHQTYNSLHEGQQEELRKYILDEMRRFSLYSWGSPTCYEQITISERNWFIVGGIGGLWVNGDIPSDKTKRGEFHSHNCDGTINQRNLFAAMIAMNTFLRNVH